MKKKGESRFLVYWLLASGSILFIAFASAGGLGLTLQFLGIIFSFLFIALGTISEEFAELRETIRGVR